MNGIDLHYLHVPGKRKDAMPLLLSHGWPGSVFEFHKLLPLLTQDFTVVAPSLPGYTLSFAPGQTLTIYPGKGTNDPAGLRFYNAHPRLPFYPNA